jgi:predicted nucleic acid-binding Zn ribbon protein
MGKKVVCNQPTKRRVSRTSFILKGGGWFKDSYSSEVQ